LSDAVGSTDDDSLIAALWELVWAGQLSNDTFAPLRALLNATTRAAPSHRSPRRTPRLRSYRRMERPSLPTRTGPPTAAGRWSRLPDLEPDATIRAHATADVLLERYGIVTRGSVMAEGVPGGFATMYKVLTTFEDSGRSRRGYFVDSLGGAQFSTSDVVDRLRTYEEREKTGAVVLAACDPANPYGAALSWPRRGESEDSPKHRPGRKAGALVVLHEGALALYVERGGKTVLTFSENDEVTAIAAQALAATVERGGVDKLLVERVDGNDIHGTPFSRLLTDAGFSATPRGYRMRR